MMSINYSLLEAPVRKLQKLNRPALPQKGVYHARGLLLQRCNVRGRTGTRAVLERLSTAVPEVQNSIVPAPTFITSHRTEVDPSLPIYVSVAADFITPSNTLASAEALRAGLKALRCLGVYGVMIDFHWGLVEAEKPQAYDWSAYRVMLKLVRECGLKAKVQLCFHGQGSYSLPRWVLEEGQKDPDIFYTDRYGKRNTNYLTLGIDQVPALQGRTALQVYSDLMRSFSQEFAPYLGSCVTEVLIGLGPDGELKYPAHCPAAGWTFPGTGEFQCYDRYMLSSLQACAQQASAPDWGLGGPHDAGSYCEWPHQSGFFHHDGSWTSEYGAFFLQWYSSMLLRHADVVLGAAAAALHGTGAKIAARLPAVHWWYNQSAHAAELTAGYYNTIHRDGYLPAMRVLQRHGAGVHLSGAEMRNSEQPDYALSDPEKLLLQQRTTAAALQLQVTVSNHSPTPDDAAANGQVTLSNQLLRFDEAALGQIEHQLFAPMSSKGVDVPQANGAVLHRLCDQMFEPPHWHPFKHFVRRVKDRADALDAAAAAQRHAPPTHAARELQPDSPLQQQPQQRQSAAVYA